MNTKGGIMVKLTDLIKESGFTVAELAKKLGVSKWAVYAWCCGRAAPRRKRISELAELLNVSKTDLFELFSD